nr:MAG TPA: hypothetical protein [Caudoviricetes sp.]
MFFYRRTIWFLYLRDEKLNSIKYRKCTYFL